MGAAFVGVASQVGVEAEAGTLTAEADGWASVVLEAPLADSGYRLTATPDLEAGDVVWYGNLPGELEVGVDVIVQTDGSITLSEAAQSALPITFDAFVDDGERGPTVEQSLYGETAQEFSGVASAVGVVGYAGTLTAGTVVHQEFGGVASAVELVATPGTLTAGTSIHQEFSGVSAACAVTGYTGTLTATEVEQLVFDGPAIADQSLRTDITDTTLDVSGRFSDSQDETLSFSLVTISGTIPTGVSINSGTGVITLTPTATNSAVIVVRATNESEDTADSNQFTVASVANQAPEWNGADPQSITVALGEGTTPVNLARYWTDPEGDAITAYALDFDEADDSELPSGWSFDTETGVLTVDRETEQTFNGLRLTAEDEYSATSSLSPEINISVQEVALQHLDPSKQHNRTDLEHKDQSLEHNDPALWHKGGR